MSKKPRVICFIDGSNLYSHLRDVFGSGRIRLPVLCHKLSGAERKLVEWRYYGAPLPQGTDQKARHRYAGQQKLFHFINTHRKGVLRLGRFQRDSSGHLHEKGVDVLLAVDLVRLGAEDRYDIAIVLSGDGDMVPAIETVQQLYGKRVEVAIPKIRAFHITQVADAYTEITRSLFDEVKL